MNRLSYFEVHVDEPPRAMKFYGDVFGWTFTKQDGLPIDYWRVVTLDGPHGGLLKRMGPPLAVGAPVNGFICSMEVKSFDDMAKRIEAGGGIVALPKFAIPGVCWQGYFLDTEHNIFGIFEPDPKAK